MNNRHQHAITSQPKQIGKNQNVKVYYLTKQETWVDMGVGCLQEIEEFNDQTEENEAYIQVQAASADEIMDTSEIEPEEQRQLNRDLENNIIIRFRFHPDNYYEKQNESIIICKEKVTALEFAISFTDSDATADFWDYIKKNGTNLSEGKSGMKDSDLEDLQIPYVDKLEETLDAFDTDFSRITQAFIYKQEFLDELFESFKHLEQEHDLIRLQLIFRIVKKLILSNEQKLIVILMSDKYFINCLGAFEYQRSDSKENYREVQSNEARFKQVIPIKDPDILEKIHFNYRLQYIKDSVIASYIEDSTSTTFNLMIMRNNLDIIDHVKERQFISELHEHFFDALSDSVKFIGELFAILSNPNFAMNMKPQVIDVMNKYGFIKVFFDGLKHVQEQEIDKDLRTKLSLKLMEGITILASDSKEIADLLFGVDKRIIAIRNLFKPKTNSSSMPAEENVENPDDDNSKNYLKQLSNVLICEDAGLQIQVVEIFKAAFEHLRSEDVDIRVVNILMKDFFMPCFEHYTEMQLSDQFVSFVLQLLEVFSISYKINPGQFRGIVIKNELVLKLLKTGAETKDKSIHLALVRLVRQLIVIDPLIVHHLIHASIIDLVWKIYKKHDRRHNLVNSTFQDMLHYILVQNSIHAPKLFKYIMSKFGTEIKAKADKNPCFKKIIEVYQDSKDWIDQERNEHLNYANSEEMLEPHPLMEAIEEEKYFDSDDRENEPISKATQKGQQEGQTQSQFHILKKQLLKEQILKRYSVSSGQSSKNDDDSDDFFSRLPHSGDDFKNDKNNGNSSQLNDSFSSNSSIVKNLNGFSLGSNTSIVKQLEINIDFDMENEKDEQHEINIKENHEEEDDDTDGCTENILLHLDHEHIVDDDEKSKQSKERLVNKKEVQLADDVLSPGKSISQAALEGESLAERSNLNDSSLNIKRPFRELTGEAEIKSNQEDHRETLADNHQDQSSAKIDENLEESEKIIVEQEPQKKIKVD